MSRHRSKTHPAGALPRTDRLLGEERGDAYGLTGKLPDPTACTACGCLYRAGRWTWGAPPADAHGTLCPACRRIEDDYPAGIVTLEGAFAAEHAGEIRALARNVEEREKGAHPLKRIMDVSENERGAVEIRTTDARLARAIGDAVHHAYQGELDYHFTDSDTLLRVRWTREA